MEEKLIDISILPRRKQQEILNEIKIAKRKIKYAKRKRTYDVVTKEDIKRVWFKKRNFDGDSYVSFENLPVEYRNGLKEDDDWFIDIDEDGTIVFSNRKGEEIEGRKYNVSCFKASHYNIPYSIYVDIHKYLINDFDVCYGYSEDEERGNDQLLGFCRIGDFVFYGNYEFSPNHQGFFYIIYMEKGKLVTFIPNNGNRLRNGNEIKMNGEEEEFEYAWSFNYKLILEEIINKFNLNESSFEQI